MARRKKQRLDDGFDSSDDSESNNNNNGDSNEYYAGMTADERDEAHLFRNPNQRGGRRFTKEDAALGIFADQNDDRNSSRFNPQRQQGISFVKTSVSTAQNSVGSNSDGETDANPDNDNIDNDDSNSDSDNNGEKNNQNEADSESDLINVSDSNSDDGHQHPKKKQMRDRNKEQEEEEELSSHAGMGLANAAFSFFSTQQPSNEPPKQKLPQNQPNVKKSSKPEIKPSKPIVLDARTQKNSSRLNPAPDKDFMKFDKDGKWLSFLKKMNYKPGEGLGRQGTGIVNPIDVKVRPQKMGLGHRGFDERTETVKTEQKIRRTENGEESESDDYKDGGDVAKKKKKSTAIPKISTSEWKQQPTSKKSARKNKKVSYKTAEELIKEAQESTTTAKSTKIIDMTGAQARELENISQSTSISQIAALKEAASHLVELRYNVRTMASEAELDLVRLTRALTLETKNIAKSEMEVFTMVNRRRVLELKKTRLEIVVGIAEKVVAEGKKLEKRFMISGGGGSSGVTLDDIDKAFSGYFQQIQSEYFDEYVEHRLDSLVIGAMAPLIKRMLLNWSPLDEPEFGLESFKKWRTLFRFSVKKTSGDGGGGSSKNLRPMTPYESMMFNVWMPKVRQDINNNWDPRNPDPCTNFLELWYPWNPSPDIIISNGLPELSNPSSPHLLPPWLHANIINQLIIPKLESAIVLWNPRENTNSSDISRPLPHTWLFPWLPIITLSRFRRTLSDSIRHKLSIHLSSPDFDVVEQTTQTLALLTPWAQVLPGVQFNALMTRHILPKLVSALRHDFHINPAHQDNRVLTSVLAWRAVFPGHVFSHLLETEFFPKWVQVLWLWLSSSSGGTMVSYGEVSRWYTAWRGFFPEDVGAMRGVCEGFKVGLDLMNKSLGLREGENLGPVPRIVPVADRDHVGGGDVEGARLAKASASSGVAGLPELRARKETQLGFQELLERTAAAAGLALLPAVGGSGGGGSGKTHVGGKPVFRLVGETSSRKGVQFYIDDGVLYVYAGGAVGDSDGRWVATPIDAVVAKAQG
ncbi:hypothetical protein HK100_012754 [Physocladia obscura]|uniref:G-patch domain-containing protein n=1 Tax=Physocladia obscura TaxID=109957 RepID=A0AAD5T244_9FUNG|nr:hypothetical protein HK100_012754 [Physocladia obscura]